MKNMLAVITLSFGLATGWQAFGATIGVEGEVRALYDRFVTAQNARDLDAVRQMLSDRPNFLWISDGKPFWGREAMIGRMASFQQAEVWRVEPEFASSKVTPGPSSGTNRPRPLSSSFNCHRDQIRRPSSRSPPMSNCEEPARDAISCRYGLLNHSRVTGAAASTIAIQPIIWTAGAEEK